MLASCNSGKLADHGRLCRTRATLSDAAASKRRSSWTGLGGYSHDKCLVVGRMKAALRQRVCITGHAINKSSVIRNGGRQHDHSLSQVTHYLVLGDSLILARVPFSACLGVGLLNFLDQDVLALSSSPNCTQPPSPQKRDRVKIARLCLQSFAASFPREQIRTHQSPFATAPSGVTLQVITRTHRRLESNILLC